MRHSASRLFSSDPVMRRQKSWKETKGPPSFRRAMTVRMKPLPMPFTAARPKRMLPSETVKPSSLPLISGGRTGIPEARHSAIYSAIFPLTSDTLESRAAMYSGG